MSRKIYGNKIAFLLFDSIKNSVFHSQVLVPLIACLNENKKLTITIVSFERKNFSLKTIQKIIPEHSRLNIIIKKKPLLISTLSLRPCVRSLKKFLRRNPFSHILARGPFAGWIALRVPIPNIPVTIQARGLAAEEFRYVMERERAAGIRAWVKRLFKNYMYWLYKKIEHDVYGCMRANFMIESVSPALKTYLEKNFGSNPEQVHVCGYDIPAIISPRQVALWRREVCQELGLPDDCYVYCYIGSARPWQCVDEMISYFISQDKRDKKKFFLILSQDRELFEEKLQDQSVSVQNYCVNSISPDETYRYLSAADAGLLFREKDPVNWVSRPTKMLEYKSVGLKIIHNNTVAWLAEDNSNL
ncbi:glycosyltransferase [Candidatus Dependentiae bacterium]|nr:glycosyltransferase [Candidatus Dependentiae bacterium]